VRFTVDDATGVVAGRAEVRFKGIPAGIIKDVRMVGDHAVLTADVAREFGPVYADAEAALRPNTPLQDKYLDVHDRGTPAAGRAGTEPLPIDQTVTGVNVSDVLQVFEPGVRAHLANLLDQLGVGLEDRGAGLRELFAELGPFITTVGRLSDQLAERGDRTRRLVHNLGEITRVLGDRDQMLRDLVRDGSTVLAQTGAGRLDIERTLGQLPPTLRELDASLTTVRGILPDVNGALSALRPAAGALPDGLAAVTALGRDAQPAIQALQAPLGRLVGLSDRLQPFSGRLRSFIDTTRPQLTDVTKATVSIAGCPAAAYMFFQHTASLTKYEDALGVYPRGDFGFGADSVSGVKDPGVRASKSCAPGGPKGATP
jgi:phospholipid/cholesterol/gamma-HCH transport system substrate-binding protein